jgi:hypothetical protein
MKKVISKWGMLSVAIFFAVACANDSTDDLVEPVEVDLITYTEHVRPIVQNNCVRCHADLPLNGAPMPLTTYGDVKNAVENRGLLDRIQRQEGEPGLMPLGGPRLPQELIDVILEWEADGLVE